MGVIDEYWSGVLQRLQAEVAVFNRLIRHQAERGRENEQALSRVLEGLVPRRLGIGTGLLFDIAGVYSKQIDIVLFDQVDSPRALAQTTQLLHPVEEVGICIEVKTTLDKEEIDDAARKKESVRSLTLASDFSPPLLFLFAYSADTSPATLGKNLLNISEDRRPDVTCVLDPGFIATQQKLLDPTSNDANFVHGVTLLHELDAQQRRLSGQYVQAQHTKQAYEERSGTVYPVVIHAGKSTLSDPSRVLLLFCEIIVRVMADRRGQPEPVLSRYLQSPYRDIESVS